MDISQAKEGINVWHANRLHSNSRVYKGVADKTAQNGYRADLREEAVARVSAVRRSQKAKKDTPAQKPRGAKARQAEKAQE